MRVLLLSHGFPPESVGGVEQHVSGLARALVEIGHEVEVYTRTAAPGRKPGELLTEDRGAFPVTRVVYRFEDVGSIADLYQSEQLERALQTFVASRQFDVAHVHHLTGLSTGSLRVLAQGGIPTAMTLHDYWMMCPRGQMWHHREEVCEAVETGRCTECLAATFPHWVRGEADRGLVEALHRRAVQDLSLPGALIVPSGRVAAPFERLGLARERIEVVENGVDTGTLGALPPAPAVPDRPLRIGYLGTVIPSKGLHVLVQACQRLPAGAACLRIHGNVVPYHGDAGYLTRVLQTLRPGDDVSYHGPYRSGELAGILQGLDLIAAPALWNEAFGLTVREGLAAGRPAVVSRIGGLQDAIVDGVQGRIVPPGDVGALADALRALAADRQALGRMAAAGRGRARGFLPMARELVEVYSRLASP